MGSPSKVRVAVSPSKAAEGSPRKAAAKLSSTTGVVKTIEKKVPKGAAVKANGEGKTAAKAKKGKTAAKGNVAEGVVVRKAQKFKVDQDVLATSFKDKIPNIYRAKIIEVRPEFTKSGLATWQYFVHYQGWAKKWDEWMDEARVLADDATGKELQAKMAQEAKELAEARKKMGKNAKPDKPESLSNIDYDSPEPKDKAMRITIPTTLQRHLMEDLDMIEDRKLVTLPRKPSVSAVLDSYLQSKAAKTAEDVAFVDGLRLLFDRSLSRLLLYRFERPQYKLLNADRGTRRDSSIYGPEHLLRLLVLLPQLIADRKFSAEELASFQSRMPDLVKYLEKHAPDLLLVEYQSADTAYMERVEREEARA